MGANIPKQVDLGSGEHEPGSNPVSGIHFFISSASCFN